jgi:hypothetical protein
MTPWSTLGQLEAALISIGCTVSLHRGEGTWWATATVGETSRACSGGTLADAITEALRWATAQAQNP